MSSPPHPSPSPKERKTFLGRLRNVNLLLGLTNSFMEPPGVFCKPLFPATCNSKSLHPSKANTCRYLSPRISELRPVLSLPQDYKGQLALEEVTWLGTMAARKAQGQRCMPIPVHYLWQTSALHKDRTCETECPCRLLVSATHNLVMLFVKHT